MNKTHIQDKFNVIIDSFDIQFVYKNGYYEVSSVYNSVKYEGKYESEYNEKMPTYIEMFKNESVCSLYKSEGNYIIELSINASLFNMAKKIYLMPKEENLNIEDLKIQKLDGKTIVEDLLKLDKEKRYEEVEDDLFTISRISTNKIWDMSLPTLINAGDTHITRRNIHVDNNLDRLIQDFYNRYPFLQNINFDNILIAGGCISNIILDLRYFSSDIDFFIYNLSEEEATNKVIKLIFQILNTEGVKLKMFIKHKYNLSIIIENKGQYHFVKIQFIFRLYKTKSAILHGFDIGSSAVGFDGKEIYFTSLSKFSYEYMMNIVDTTRRSTTYEKRLIKYFRRGFGIILPKLNIEPINSFCINMPYLRIYKRLTHANIIFVKNMEKGSEYYKRFGTGKKNTKNNNDDYDDNEFEIGYSVDKLVDIQKKILLFMEDENKEIKINDIIEITWKVENPGTQLTSSFNPIIEDEHLWYGEYYLQSS